jgi:hypothetical protein
MNTQESLRKTLIATLVALAPLTTAHATTLPPALAWSPSGQYNFGSTSPGQTASQIFTLSNTWGKSSGTITVTLKSDSSAFTITNDGCTGTALRPSKSCNITVQYAPTDTAGDTATLQAAGQRTAAGVTLVGSGGGSGTADLHISPGPTYSFGAISEGSSVTQTFTVTNYGTAASETLSLVQSGNADAPIWLSNDMCSGTSLAENGGSCTFELTFSTEGGCQYQAFSTQLVIYGSTVSYILLSVSGFCL